MFTEIFTPLLSGCKDVGHFGPILPFSLPANLKWIIQWDGQRKKKKKKTVTIILINLEK